MQLYFSPIYWSVILEKTVLPYSPFSAIKNSKLVCFRADSGCCTVPMVTQKILDQCGSLSKFLLFQIAWEFHTCTQCVSVKCVPHLPCIPFLSCLSSILHLNFVCFLEAHGVHLCTSGMLVGTETWTGAWVGFLETHPWRKLTPTATVATNCQ